ncbi:hypothetical protein SAMN02745174_02075 [Cetobacterium ceti]|uniref:Uncharacterized protein n=1 Tax=Cetobacterium ceti TaxID=180163 RepID=A0A1T4PWJ1_9FUSO|nr:hypothetical protein [Cetobacterium ceti]SJZ95746.1 hypothetical protein SAMN02745174_02075 [Cetobacterium ceti]
MIKKTAIEKLKSQIVSSYESTFDFGSYEIEESVKKIVVEKEAIMSNAFKSLSKSQYEICKALYEVSLHLKAEGSFMAWYTHIGLSKDKVSELLKRYEVFIQLPGKELYVSTLSNQAIKLLTRKDFEIDYLLEVGDLQLKKVEDIRAFINSKITKEEKVSEESNLDKIIEFNFNEFKTYENKIKVTKNIAEVKNYKKEISKLKAKLLELEELCNEKIELSINEHNLKLY